MTTKTEKKPTASLLTPEGIVQDMMAVANNANATPEMVKVAANVIAKEVKKIPGVKAATKNIAPSTADKIVKATVKATVAEDAVKTLINQADGNVIAQQAPTFKDLSEGKVVSINGKPRAHFSQGRGYGRPVARTTKLSELDETRVVSIEEFNKLDSGVIVMGMLLLPLDTVKANDIFSYQTWRTEGDAEDLWIGRNSRGSRFITNEKLDSEVFSVYRFILNNKLHEVFACAKSKIWIGDLQPQSIEWDLREEHVDRDKATHLVIKDSVAVDCHFFGSSVLVNVELAESTVDESVIAFEDQIERHVDQIPWTGRRIYNKKDREKPGVFKNSYFTQMEIENTELPNGSYYQGIFRNSIIECSGRVTTRKASLKSSTVKCSDSLFLGKCDIENSVVKTKGAIRLHIPSLRNMHVYSDSLYVRNKFGITEINSVGEYDGSFMLVRINKDEMALHGIQTSKKFVFKLNESEWRLRADLTQWLRSLERKDEEGTTQPYGHTDQLSSPITESILKYFEDTVVSRVKAINLLDDALKVARDVERQDMSRYFDRYF